MEVKKWQKRRKRKLKRVRYTETQPQKFSGNDCNDNEVTVNFKNKSVVFNPVDNHPKWFVFIDMMGTIYFALTYYILFPLALLYRFKIINIYITSIVIFVIFCIIYIYPFLVFNKNFMKNYYPKVNAFMVQWCNNFTIMPSRWCRWKTYTNVDENNVISLPKFKNIFLYYETSEDFSKYLEYIEIKSCETLSEWRKKYSRPHKWLCLFIYKKKPINGYLKVKYK
jgi:hypothetical protein